MGRIPTIQYIFLIALGAMAAGCGSQEEGEDRSRRGRGDRAVQIVAQPVEFIRQETRIEAVGTARARSTATIYAETGGRVTQILFQAEDYVEKDAALVKLEDDDERLAVRRAEVAVKSAEQLLARYRRIEGTGAVSASQIDEAQTALEAARIDLDRAKVTLADRTVKAPFAGHVGLTDVDPGDRITNATIITQLDDRAALYVDFEAPEQAFARVSIGTPVSAEPFASAEQRMDAEVIGIDSRIDPTRRTFIVRAAIDNAADTLRPGMSFRIAVSFPGDPYPTVPEAAILWGSSGAYLWVIREGRARRIAVNIIARRAGQVQVRADLEDGEVIVTEGVQKVREGTRVNIIDPDASRQPLMLRTPGRVKE